MIKVIKETEKSEMTEKYVGRRIRLLKMDDPQAPPPGTLGIVKWVDDIGQLHVVWDNGSRLALIEGEDLFEFAYVYIVTVVKDKYHSECGEEIAGIFSSQENAQAAKRFVESAPEEDEYVDSEVMIYKQQIDNLAWYKTDIFLTGIRKEKV